MAPRLTKLTVSGLKSLHSIELSLGGLKVLIGDNGSGKSSILEALELLRKTTQEGFVARVASAHGGLNRLLEDGAEQMSLGALIDDGQPEPLAYLQLWTGESVPREAIGRGKIDDHAWFAEQAALESSTGGRFPKARTDSLVFSGASRHEDIASVAAAFRGIDVHLPFQVTAPWSTPGQHKQSPRGVSLLEPTDRLERFGTNLVNTYQALKNDFGADHWQETLEYVQLGFNFEIRDVVIGAIPGGGHIALSLETRLQGRIPAFSLADGMLCYLAFVAMFRLDEHRTLLAFDEPELHLHPGLLGRVLGMFEAMSDRYPVLLATHSDRLLDGLLDPKDSVITTELDVRGRTRLRGLDEARLSQWLESYRGLGELRADGELDSVLAPVDEPPGVDDPPELGEIAAP